MLPTLGFCLQSLHTLPAKLAVAGRLVFFFCVVLSLPQTREGGMVCPVGFMFFVFFFKNGVLCLIQQKPSHSLVLLLGRGRMPNAGEWQ